jgi:predicted membrane protein
MSSFEVGLVAFACMFGGALMGMLVHLYIPQHHQCADTQRIVNLAAGIIAGPWLHWCLAS